MPQAQETPAATGKSARFHLFHVMFFPPYAVRALFFCTGLVYHFFGGLFCQTGDLKNNLPIALFFTRLFRHFAPSQKGIFLYLTLVSLWLPALQPYFNPLTGGLQRLAIQKGC